MSVTEYSCQAFGERLDNKAAPGWVVGKPDYVTDTKVIVEPRSQCRVGLRNTKISYPHVSWIDPASAFLKGAIVDSDVRNVIHLDIPLVSLKSFEGWVKRMKKCGCRDFEAHPHYVTEKIHDYFKVTEDAPGGGLIPALREAVKNRGPPTAIHAHCWAPREQRYCVTDNALRET